MNKLVLGLCLLISIGALSLSLYNLFSSSKSNGIVYVDLNKLHNEFKMKKDLEQKLTQSQQQRKAILDSIVLDIEVLDRRVTAGNADSKTKAIISDLVASYENKQKVFGEDAQLQSADYDRQIWNQLNQYVQDYRKQNSGYKLILGVSGNGSVMDADKSLDITDDVVKYVNGRYDGKGINIK